MKIGVIKIGERITLNSKSRHGLVPEEPIVLIKSLSQIDELDEVIVGTAFRPSDKFERSDINDKVKFENLDDGYDNLLSCSTLICWGGYINFWGGVEAPHIINQYKLINEFKGRIIWVVTDSVVVPKQLWPMIKERKWGHTEEEILVTRNDIELVLQAKNSDEMLGKIKNFDISKTSYANLWKLPTVFNASIDDVNEDPEVDLIYGQVNNRPTRIPKIKKYFFDTGLNIGLYGRDIRKDEPVKKLGMDLSHVDFLGIVKFGQAVLDLNNKKSLATVVIGDPSYEAAQLMPNRFAEAVMSNIVAFIDVDLDPEKTFIKDDFLNRFLYVETTQDVVDRVQKLKADPRFRRMVLEKQQELFKNSEPTDFAKDILK